jgi:Family of unknown function (DUF6503)
LSLPAYIKGKEKIIVALANSFKQFSSSVMVLTLLALPFPLYAQTKTGSDVIAAMISAHGGMEKWRSAPTVSFEDHFKQSGAPNPMISQVTVEQGRRRAYLDFPELKSRIVWDGKQAWSENWNAPIPPRFLALLNYYFLNLPWLAMDAGVNLGNPGKGKLWNDRTEYITVKMTFNAGVGDTPNDYYLLYIDPKSNRLKACEYIATYASILPPGAKASPPHVLVYETTATVEGLVVPTRYTIHDKNHSTIASCEIRNWSFKKPFDATRLTKPPGAVIDNSSPSQQTKK